MCDFSARVTVRRFGACEASPTISCAGYSHCAASLWMLAAILLVILSATMKIGENRTVYLPFVSTPVPESCAMYRYFGLDCPGCGLTRTFIHLAHGRLVEGLNLNPIGLIVFAFTIVQIPLGFGQLILGWRGDWLRSWPTWNERALIALVFALSLQWLARLLG